MTFQLSLHTFNLFFFPFLNIWGKIHLQLIVPNNRLLTGGVLRLGAGVRVGQILPIQVLTLTPGKTTLLRLTPTLVSTPALQPCFWGCRSTPWAPKCIISGGQKSFEGILTLAICKHPVSDPVNIERKFMDGGTIWAMEASCPHSFGAVSVRVWGGGCSGTSPVRCHGCWYTGYVN